MMDAGGDHKKAKSKKNKKKPKISKNEIGMPTDFKYVESYNWRVLSSEIN